MATVNIPVVKIAPDVSVTINIDSVSLLGMNLVFAPGAAQGISWSYTLLGVPFTGSIAAGGSPTTSVLTGLVSNANLSQIVVRTV